MCGDVYDRYQGAVSTYRRNTLAKSFARWGPGARYTAVRSIGKRSANPMKIAISSLFLVISIAANADWKDEYRAGKAAFGLSDLETAISHFTEAIKLGGMKPKRLALIYRWRGSAHGNLARYGLALSDFDAAIRTKPDYADAYASRCFSYGRTRRFVLALADCTKAISLDPESAAAYEARADIFDQTGQFENSIQDYDRAIELGSEGSSAITSRGITYRKHGDLDAAITDFNRALEFNASHATSYYARGKTYELKGVAINGALIGHCNGGVCPAVLV